MPIIRGCRPAREWRAVSEVVVYLGGSKARDRLRGSSVFRPQNRICDPGLQESGLSPGKLVNPVSQI